MELARDVNRSNAQTLGRRKDPEVSSEKKYQVIAIELSMRHQPEIVNLYRVMSSNSLPLFTGRTSGTPSLGCLAGRLDGSSATSICSGSGMHAIESE